MSTYSELLKDRRWAELSTRIKKERGNKCEYCEVSGPGVELHLHHGLYIFGVDPWDYDEKTMWVLCREHHAVTHEDLKTIRLDSALKTPLELNKIANNIRDKNATQARWHRKAEHEFLKELAAALAEIEESPFMGIEVAVCSSHELGLSRASELIENLEDEFPGISCTITRSDSDCAVSVTIDRRYVDPLTKLIGYDADDDLHALFELEQESKAENIRSWAEIKKRSWGL